MDEFIIFELSGKISFQFLTYCIIIYYQIRNQKYSRVIPLVIQHSS